MRSKDFGPDFVWGVASSAYQTEGAHNIDGKGLSIWDDFTSRGKARYREHANHATDFYHRYVHDLALMRSMHIRNFRFSISWSRIFPNGTGKINPKGLEFYHRLIDTALELGIEPWITLYHWDLPLALEQRGGWTNREVLHWFENYAVLCAKEFGDRVKRWMVLNEPMVFTGAGYFMGVHAPGRRGLIPFLKATHHAVLVQGHIPSVLRYYIPDAKIGTTYSCSHLDPYSSSESDLRATQRADILLNRLFLEPTIGRHYPVNEFRTMERIFDHIGPRDDHFMQGKYDFIGIQNYTREVVTGAWYIPYLKARLVPANKRKVPHTLMNWEVYPDAIYHSLKKFAAYPEVKEIFITENGAAFQDVVDGNRVHDPQRMHYLQSYLEKVLQAKQEGAPVKGYFIWSFTDNFEWAEGYTPRFGIVHVDFKTQQRRVKDSGKWYASFIQESDH